MDRRKFLQPSSLFALTSGWAAAANALEKAGTSNSVDATSSGERPKPGETAVLLDVLTGLRVSELLALKWSDVDFENLELHVTRSISLRASAAVKRRHRRSRFHSTPSRLRFC